LLILLAGALFTSLAPSTIALAIYFCINDLILISQCTYYNTLNARRRARRAAHAHHHHHHHHHRRRLSSATDPSTSTAAAVLDSPAPTPQPTEQDPLLAHETTGAGLPGSHRRRASALSTNTDALTRIITGDDGSADSNPWVQNAISLVAVWVVGVAGWWLSYKMGAWEPKRGGDDGGNGAAGVVGVAGEEPPLKVVGMVLGYASAVLYLWYVPVPPLLFSLLASNLFLVGCGGWKLMRTDMTVRASRRSLRTIGRNRARGSRSCSFCCR
jgi:hypothetical protein